MRIFITGASGYIGRVVTEQAMRAGHEVLALVRSESGLQTVRELGATPIPGDLNSIGTLEGTAAETDAVLHLAFVHDWNLNFADVLGIEIRAVETLAAGLRGTGKPLVISSATALAEPSPVGEETDEWAPTSNTFILKDRIKAERACMALSDKGARVIAMRLPPYVHGRGGSSFIPMLMKGAAERGVSAYVNDGSKRTSAVHVEDAARAYLLAIEKGEAGSVFNCTSETGITTRSLAEAIGEAVGVPAKGYSRVETERLWGTFLTAFFDYENRASSARLREQLGWQPQARYGLLEDITQGSYTELSKNLRAGSQRYAESE